MQHRYPWRPLCVALGLALVAFNTHAQSDAEVYENAIARAAQICPGHSTERTSPGVRAIGVGALRVLAQRRFTLCPDRRLGADTPVVWYGEVGVFAWNPEAKGSVALLAGKVDTMTRKEEFPPGTVVWKADGSEAKGVTVPMFERRPRPVN